MTVKLEPISIIITILAFYFVVVPAMKKENQQKHEPVVLQEKKI
jgi:hypothetical protein